MLRVGLFVFLTFSASVANADFRRFAALAVDPALERELARVAVEILSEFSADGLKEGNLSLSLVDLSNPTAPKRASYRGEIPYHPASVVKAFYLVSMHEEIRRTRLKMDEALRKAAIDMIVDSGNDATSYVVDRITGTTSGPELHGRAFQKFVGRRNLMNRYFRGLGYDISANGKTWCEGVYGREKQILGPNRESRNRFTSDSFAALMLWIAQRQAVSPAASDAMLGLMRRALMSDSPAGVDSQVTEFTGASLPPGSKLWSKAGWTSEVRHDMALVELPDGRRYVLAVMTRGTGENKRIMPEISRRVVALFR